MMWARYGTDDRIEGARSLLRRAAREGRELRNPALGALAASMVATAARLLGPLVVRGGVDDGIIAGDRGAVARSAVVYTGLFVVQYLAARWSLYAVTSVGERYLRGMRVRVYRHLMNLDIGYFGRTKAGVLVSRLTSDIEALNAFANEGAIAVITSTLTVLGVSAALVYTDRPLAWFVLGVFPVLLGASIVFRRFADRAYRAVREQIGLVLGSLQEGIAGVRVVQAYTQERGQLRQFHRVNQEYFKANLAAARAISTYFPVVDFLRTASSALVLFVGGSRVLDGSMSIGSLIAFLLYLNWFFEPIVQLSNVYNLLQGALAALSKLFGILDRRPVISDPEDPVVPAQRMNGRIDFEGVRFGYDPAVPVLEGLDLFIPAGQRVAVVGETGAGKSTVAKLAVRFYDPQEGRISIDGVDLRDLAVASLRANVAMVPQEGFLFDGSIRDNITYSNAGLSDDEVWKICAQLGIDTWVRGLPERLDTEVRERGSRLSSGERQLVSLARALAADPAVIVLDEATSNLDPETESAVERALGVLLSGRTSIVIAHRLQTAERADRILVIDRGRVVEDGTFDGLSAAGGHFAALRQIWKGADPLK